MYPAETYLDYPELLGPQLSPDGNRVAFLWNTTGRRELYVAPADGSHEPHQLTDTDLRGWAFGSDYTWQPNGDGLYVLRFPQDDPDRASISAVTLDGEWTHLFEIDEISLHWAPVGDDSLVGPADQDKLSLFNRSTNTFRPLVEDSRNNFQCICVSPDNQTVAFWAVTPERESTYDAFITHLGDEAPPVPIVPDTEGLIVPVAWHPDDGWLLIHDATEARYGRFEPEERTVDWIVDAPETEFVLDTEDTDQPIGFFPEGDGILTLPDGEPAVVNANFDLDVDVSNVIGADTRNQSAAFATEGTANAPPRLVTVAGPDMEQTTVISGTYGLVSPADNVSATEYTYESSAGETRVLVHRPRETPAPAVVLTYPKESIYEEFPRWVQYLVYRGYAVARPSIPEARTDAEHENTAAVGRWLANREWIDSDRVAVLGHSAGGGQVLEQVFTHDVWAAGIARAAPQSYFPDDISTLMAPLRIHHPVYDTVVPVEEAREIRNMLCDAGYVEGEDFEYAELFNQWHITADIRQNADELTRIIDFLNRNM